MVKPSRRGPVVERLVDRYLGSERRACRISLLFKSGETDVAEPILRGCGPTGDREEPHENRRRGNTVDLGHLSAGREEGGQPRIWCFDISSRKSNELLPDTSEMRRRSDFFIRMVSLYQCERLWVLKKSVRIS